jgi:predicted transcriptional regulator
MSTSLSVGKDTNKRAKIQIIFEIFQAEVSSTLVKYTKYICNANQKQEKNRIITKYHKKQTANQVLLLS